MATQVHCPNACRLWRTRVCPRRAIGYVRGTSVQNGAHQIHVQYSAFSEITYDNSNKILTYGPGNILTDQIRPFIDIHLGKQFYFGPKPNKGYPSRSYIYNFLSILLKNRKNDEASYMDFKIESPNYGNQR